MTVYILKIKYRKKGKTGEEPLKIYDSLKKAQSQMAATTYSELCFSNFDHILLDGKDTLALYDLSELSMMYHDDPKFSFDVKNIEMWKDEKNTSDEYVILNIEEHTIL